MLLKKKWTPDKTLKVLLVEDDPSDAAFVRLSLTSRLGTGFELQIAGRLVEALGMLAASPFDVVLLDPGLPDSQGLATFSVLHARFRDVPVLLLSGPDAEALAFDAVRLGAQDYLVKGKYDEELLARSIYYAIERQRTLRQVEQALTYVKCVLNESGDRHGSLREKTAESGMLAMCAWCKKIRDDDGRWVTIEDYLAPRTGSTLTHGACPECSRQVRQEFGAALVE